MKVSGVQLRAAVCRHSHVLNLRLSSALALSGAVFCWLGAAFAEPVHVKYLEGSFHGFLAVRNEEGKSIGAGDVDQTANGSRVTIHLTIRFLDGSLHDETTVFTQHGVFRVLSDHLLETGPTFKNPVEAWIDTASGTVKVRDMKDGKDKTDTHHLAIPSDLSNGVVTTILKDLPGDAPHTVTVLAITPKPRIVKLVLKRGNPVTLTAGETKLETFEYLGKVEIGGVSGVVAPLAGKEPPESHFWILGSGVPIVLKSVAPISADPTVWQIELSGPDPSHWW